MTTATETSPAEGDSDDLTRLIELPEGRRHPPQQADPDALHPGGLRILLCRSHPRDAHARFEEGHPRDRAAMVADLAGRGVIVYEPDHAEAIARAPDVFAHPKAHPWAEARPSVVARSALWPVGEIDVHDDPAPRRQSHHQRAPRGPTAAPARRGRPRLRRDLADYFYHLRHLHLRDDPGAST